MYERRVNIQNLINLSKREGRIDEFELAAESERLYRRIKVIGKGLKNPLKGKK